MNRFVLFLAFCVAFSSAFVHVRNVRSLLKRAGCVDKLSNCKAFGANACSDQQYAQWATENCALTCNKCQSSGGSVPMPVQGVQPGMVQSTGCTDKLTTCAQYGKTVCSDSTYTQWVHTNCQAYCGTCQNSGGSVPQPGTNQGTQGGTHQGGQSFNGHSSGCVYKGVVHQQGETWKDGCTYKCTCADGTTGKYTCTGICLQWNLPDSCTMNPPAPGKCCKTPNCPSSVQVQYPDGYVAE